MSQAIHPGTEMNTQDEGIWKSCDDTMVPEDSMLETRKELVRNFIRINYSHQKLPLKEFVNNVEKELIEHALLVTFWNQRQASELLGLKPTCLNEKIKKFGIKRMEPGGNGIPVHQLQEMVRVLSE